MKAGRLHTSDSAAETEALGMALAPALAEGDLLALCGPLGAGKTRFVSGLARGLASRSRVRSPTYGLVHEYGGRIRLVHVDLYRVDGADLESLGLSEYADRALVVVEWGERLPMAWSDRALRIDFEIGPEDRRVLRASAGAARSLELLAAWDALEPVSPPEGA